MAEGTGRAKRDAERFKAHYAKTIAAYLADPENTADMPPALLAGYDFISIHKESAHRRMYVVRRKRDGVMGFLKFAGPEGMDVPNRARREAEVLEALDHPAIPKVLDCWDGGDGSYLVREYVEGVPLHIALAERRADGRGLYAAPEALALARQVGEVLAYLEGQAPPVVHRDIKPQNIILTPAGAYWLVDFDTARRFDPAKLHDTTLGKTEGFAAPEQYGYRQSDPSADRYGLGVSLLYMVAGVWDVDGGLSRVADPGLRYLIARCCAFAPAQRFASAGAMLGHIRALEAGFVPLAGDASVQGSTLEAYAGRDRRLLLQGVSHIAENAFARCACTTVEEVMLSSIFSPLAVPALRALEKLTRIWVEDENAELTCYDGALYSKNLSRLLCLPAGKRGTWRIPAQMEPLGRDDPVLDDLYAASRLEAVEVDPRSHAYRAYDGMLATRGGMEVVCCPRGKAGKAHLPPDTLAIWPRAFWGCGRLTDVALPPGAWDPAREDMLYETVHGQRILTKAGKRYRKQYGEQYCRLFEGCYGLPLKYRHQWQDYCARFPAGREVVCTRCGAVRDATHAYPPMFGQEGVSAYLAEEEIGEGTSLEAAREKRWRTTGVVVSAHEMESWLAEWDQESDEVYWRIDPGMKLTQMVWDSEEVIHAGVTRGTVGGWMEIGAEVDGTAWLDPYTLVFAGAKVLGQARVSGGARIKPGGVVFDHAVVDGGAVVERGAYVFGFAHVTGGTCGGADGTVRVCGKARVKGNAVIRGQVKIHGNAHISGSPRIEGGDGSGRGVIIGGAARIEGSPHIQEDALIVGHARVWGEARVCGNVAIEGDAQVGGRACLDARGVRLVEHSAMTDGDRADMREDNDWRWNSYGHSEWREEPHSIHIGGRARIEGDALLVGSAVYRGDAVVDTGMDVGAVRFTRMVYDERQGEWVDGFVPEHLPGTVLHRLAFTVPALGGGGIARIRVEERLAPYLTFFMAEAPYNGRAGGPYLPRVYRNERTQEDAHRLEPAEHAYGITYERHPHPAHNGFAADGPGDLGNGFTLAIEGAGLLSRLKAGDHITLYYRVLADTRAMAMDEPVGIVSRAKLTINGLTIPPQVREGGEEAAL